jgi:hypothetical protein
MRGAWLGVLAMLACAEVVPEPVQSRAGSLGTLVVLDIPSRESADAVRGQIIRGGRLLAAIDDASPTLVLGYAESPEQLGWTEGTWTHDASAAGRLRAPQALWAPDATSVWSDAEARRGDRALRELRFPVPEGELCARGDGCVAADPAAPGARWCAPCTAPPPTAPTPPRPPEPGACGEGWSLAAVGGADDTAELRAVQLCDAPTDDCADLAQRHEARRGCVDLGSPCPSAATPWATPPSGRVRWVSPTGRADGAGDAAAPWSLAHALEAAEPDEALLLARGEYSLTPDTRLTRARRWVGACAAETRVTTTGTLTVAAAVELDGLRLSSPALALTPEATLTARGVVLEAVAIDVPEGASLALDDAHVYAPRAGTLTVRGRLVAAGTDLRRLGLRITAGEATLVDVQSRGGAGLILTQGATLTGTRVRLSARDVAAAVDVSGGALTLEGSAITAMGAMQALRVTAGGTSTVVRTWLRGNGGQGAVSVSGAQLTLRDVVADRTLRADPGGHLLLERVVVARASGHALRSEGAVLLARDLSVEGGSNGIQLEEGSQVTIERGHFRRLQKRGVQVPGQATSTLELTDVTLEQLGGFGISADRARTLSLRRVAVRGVAGAALVADARTSRTLDAEDLDIADVTQARSGADCEGVSCTGVGLRLAGNADVVSLRRFRIMGYEARAISAVTNALTIEEGTIGLGPIGIDAPLPEPDDLLNVQNLATEAWVR